MVTLFNGQIELGEKEKMKKSRTPFVFLLVLMLSVFTLPVFADEPGPMDFGSSEAQTIVDQLFEGYEGTIIIHDSASGVYLRHNPLRGATRFPPCSTFKIPNSLIALELGVLADADHVIPWDPEQDPKQDWWSGPILGEWPRDHDLRSAMKNSVVWYYQEVARRIRVERMKKHLGRINYGNQDISGGIDRFWLSSTLQISAAEQVEFLRRLHDRRLDYSERSTVIVEEIIERESGPGHVYRGKTGGGQLENGRRIGWLVGWVERGDQTFTFALNLEGDSNKEIWGPRIQLTRTILAALGILPPQTS
jgi:beta-lactamase class D